MDWHLPGGSLYWPLHDRCGCNNYGDGIGPAESLNQESYFSWPANNDPTEDDMFAAAQLIKERCDHIRSHHAGFTKVRLIGHSAGCNVCSMATHLLADYQIEHLVLLSPPTYLPNSSHPHRKFPKYYRYVFPNLSHIQGGEFVSVRPAGDSVLAGFAADNVRRHFRFDAFRRYPDANISRVPDTQELGRTEFVVSSPVNHWQPCNPTNWSDAIWTAIGCRPTPDSARPNPATPRAFGPAKSLRNRV
ncbi:MAG: hypothetical protein JNM18_07215 [Planctomycetaceae bacterium]|nr:hypothetical protein [Planctomycetaceae bacterium]